MTALSCRALFQIEVGKIETALMLYTQASQMGHVGNSRWYQDVVGQHIDVAAEALSPIVVETTKE